MKERPKMSKGKKIAIVIMAWLLIFSVDFVCVKTKNDPIFAFPYVFVSDGGSAGFMGIFYKVERRFVGELGDGSPKKFEYYILPWFVKR